ncbi:hypothetical protein MNBD_BACTEROID07-169 [hydrothermal vent metagenome]|uniref:Uncharacterized protein n=1 Tax=hydrothermal vent metagenome TaxID=652676 RepID=A0A3B0UBK8_9ZZZZ
MDGLIYFWKLHVFNFMSLAKIGIVYDYSSQTERK